MTFTTFVPDILATVIGGVILTFLFFLLKEKVFSIPAIKGTWKLTQLTETSQYKPYVDMELEYFVLLRTEGNKIYGTLEKTHEKSSTGERNYVGEARSKGMIDGYIEKRIFSQDRVHMHIYETNHKRSSSTLHLLVIIKENGKYILKGNFSSTIANQLGKSTWNRIR